MRFDHRVKSRALPLAVLAVLVIFGLQVVAGLVPTEAAPVQGERVVLDFETASFDPQRVISVSGFPGWGVSDCAASEGNRAAWSLGEDTQGSKRACDDPPPQAVETSMLVLLDLEEFDAQIPRLELIFDLRMAVDRPTSGPATSSFLVNLIEQTGAATPSRITVFLRQDSTQAGFEEQRLDLTRLQDVNDPNRDPINLAGATAFVELMYVADPVTGQAPAGVFVDHVRLAFGDVPSPSETATPTIGSATPGGPSPTPAPGSPSPTASPPPPSPAPPGLFLPRLER